jgi:hypothetical protein
MMPTRQIARMAVTVTRCFIPCHEVARIEDDRYTSERKHLATRVGFSLGLVVEVAVVLRRQG